MSTRGSANQPSKPESTQGQSLAQRLVGQSARLQEDLRRRQEELTQRLTAEKARLQQRLHGNGQDPARPWTHQFVQLEPISKLESGSTLRPNRESSFQQTTNFLKITAQDLRAELQLLPCISYALQHIGIAAIQEFKLHNQSWKDSQNLLIEISIQPSDLGEAWQHTIQKIPAGSTFSIGNVSLPLRLERLRQILEKEQAHLRFTVSDQDEVLLARTESLPVLPYNHWLPIQEHLELTAAFVQPNQAALHPVLKAATKRLEDLTGDKSFAGYQTGGGARVMQMLQVLHDTLAQDMELGYINPLPSFERVGQKIRLVADTLAQGRGTCLDLAILQISLWEHIGLHPLLVLVPGHAFMACWMTEMELPRPAVFMLSKPSADQTQSDGQHSPPNNLPEENEQKFTEWRRQLCASYAQVLNSSRSLADNPETTDSASDFPLCVFNSVEIGSKKSLSQAQANAEAYVSSHLEKGETIQFIDIVACRMLVTPLP